MKYLALVSLVITVFVFGVVCQSQTEFPASRDRYTQMLDELYQKDTVTIVLTDSGLGGLSVTAALEKMVQDHRAFRQVRLVFANALPERGYAYNQMAGTVEKARVFSAALDGINAAFHPDIILIACNTLSVVYPETEFAAVAKTPVMGIVEFGVDGLFDALRADSAASVIILGTPTTIEQESHADGLIARGISRSRITTQACEMLESEIQADPHSDMVNAMVEMFAAEALARDSSGHPGNLVVGLCCSHYGFSRDIFQIVFEAATDRPVIVVDPNLAMQEFVIPPEYRGRFDTTGVTVQVVSRTELLPDELVSISTAVRPRSAATADAIMNYTLDRNLFTLTDESR